MNNILKTIILLFLFTFQISIYANDEHEEAVETIVQQTENYICNKIEEVVEDRYDCISSPRVWWDVIISSDETRKKNWTTHFEENNISKEGIQDFINELVDKYNSKLNLTINRTSLSEFNILDDVSFNLIVKRERYEIYCWLLGLLLPIPTLCIIGFLIGAIFGVDSAKKIPFAAGCLVMITPIIISAILAYFYIVPIEIDIANSITEYIFQQISNMNIFEQL